MLEYFQTLKSVPNVLTSDTMLKIGNKITLIALR